MQKTFVFTGQQGTLWGAIGCCGGLTSPCMRLICSATSARANVQSEDAKLAILAMCRNSALPTGRINAACGGQCELIAHRACSPDCSSRAPRVSRATLPV